MSVIPCDLCETIAQTLLNDELLDEQGCVELVKGVEMPLAASTSPTSRAMAVANTRASA